MNRRHAPDFWKVRLPPPGRKLLQLRFEMRATNQRAISAHNNKLALEIIKEWDLKKKKTNLFIVHKLFVSPSPLWAVMMIDNHGFPTRGLEDWMSGLRDILAAPSSALFGTETSIYI